MDYLQFEGGNAPGGTHRTGWNGDWPPPERLCMLVGNESGMVAINTPEVIAENRAGISDAGTITVMTFRLENYSKLPPQEEGSHLARGAKYVPMEA